MAQKKREPMDWYDIQNEFESMQRMSCVPTHIHKVPTNHIFDENQSVKWNREQVEKNNLAYAEEVARLNTLKNKERDRICENIYYAIQCDVGCNLPRNSAILIWNFAYELGHSFGIYNVLAHLETIISLIKKLLSDKGVIRCGR